MDVQRVIRAAPLIPVQPVDAIVEVDTTPFMKPPPPPPPPGKTCFH